MLAFLFLLYDTIEHQNLWEQLFRQLIQLNVSFKIYAHCKTITERTPHWIRENAIKSIPTAWGEYSLLKAELLLFRAALKDKKTDYFILASGACIPVHNAQSLVNKLTRDHRSCLDITYNTEYNFWGCSQWMYLYRTEAKEFVRLLNPKDKEASTFLNYWKKETSIDGENCSICEVNGPDEVIPIQWFLYLYGPPDSPTFKKHIRTECMTYAYFKPNTTHPVLWTSKNLKPFHIWEIRQCLFARKFDTSSLPKLFGEELTKSQISQFIRKKGREKNIGWGRPK